MEDKFVPAAGGIIIAILLAVTIILNIGVDRKPPVISYDRDISYTEGQDISTLLVGVRAYDDKDGDVTANVIVESLIVLEDKTTARVNYTARDNSNNVTKDSRIIAYSGSGKSIYSTSATEFMSVNNKTSDASDDETTPYETTDSPTTESPTTESETTKEETTTEEVTTQEETTTETVSVTPTVSATGEPTIILRAHEGTINVGGFFNVANYVSDILDDKDERNALFRRIGIEGKYDSRTAGDYTFSIYCIDSDRNISNKEKFTLHVIE